MSSNHDPIDDLTRAIDQTGDIIGRVDQEQGALPTPCRAWDLRTLVNHIVRDVRMFTASATESHWEPGDTDLIGNDWSGSYRNAAGSLLEAWGREGALQRTMKLRMGEVPATWSVGQQTADIIVHGWDVAKATGQSTELDPDLGQMSLDWGRQNLRQEFRGDETNGKMFGVEVSVAEEAPVYDRLAGVFGRDPNWTPDG